MAFTIQTCYLVNKVDVANTINPVHAQRSVVVRICDTTPSNANLVLQSPYTITTKDSGSNIVAVATGIASSGSATCISVIAWSSATMPAGNYTVEVSSAISPTVIGAITVTLPTETALATETITDPACGANSGVLDLALTGPLATQYELRLTHSGGPIISSGASPGTSLSFTGLAPGTYWFRMTFVSSCHLVNVFNYYTDTFVLANSSLLITADISITPAICDDTSGAIEATPTNGTGPYTYLYDDGKGGTSSANPYTGLTVGTYTLVITDANGCTGNFTIVVPTQPGSCGGCYSLTDCFPSAQGTPVYYVHGSLQGLDGYIINGVEITGQYMDPTKCWLVTAVSTDACEDALPLTAFNDFFSECAPCQFVPEEPEVLPTQSYQEPVKVFFQIAESRCDIQAIRQFAGGYQSLIKKLRYGITDCCKTYNLEQSWVNKQLSDLTEMTVAGYECRAATTNRCTWLPLNCCEVVPGTSGGISILAIAGEDILFGKLVMLSNDGKLYLNDPTVDTTYQRCVGFTTMDVLQGATTRILVMGLYTNVNWSLTSGSIYYASASGGITSTIPTNPPLAISQMIGVATSSTTLLVDIKQPNIL